MSKLNRYRQKAYEGRQHTSGLLHYAFLTMFLVLQIALLVLAFLVSRRYFAHFYVLCEFVSLCVVLYIVREDSGATYKIPWILLALALPVLGGFSYLMFGRVRFSREEQRKLKENSFRYANAAFEIPDQMDQLREDVPELRRQVEYIRQYAAAPVYSGTNVQYFRSGEDLYGRMIPELKEAKRFIFLEYFIIHQGRMWDTVEKLLIQKAREGVEVRLIYDDIGSMGLVPHDYVQYLAQNGISAVRFNRLTNIFTSRFNNRDHRKICVIDGKVGFTGGVNMADEYINRVRRFGYWKDTGVMLEGAAVRSLTAIFLSNWDLMQKKTADFLPYLNSPAIPDAPGYVQPFSDTPYDGERTGEGVYRNLLNRAQSYVYITTPYLIIDDTMVDSLATAAKSGVDVRIVTPGIPDKKIAYTLTRSYYEVLLRAGVRIFEYTPGFMHAKVCVSDDRCAVVGTINMDYRSFCHHFECAVWMCDVPAIADMKRDLEECFARSREITLGNNRKRFIIAQVWQAVLRIIAPLF